MTGNCVRCSAWSITAPTRSDGRRGRQRRTDMWQKLKKSHPWLYEAEEWAVLGLSVGAFLLALAVYLR